LLIEFKLVANKTEFPTNESETVVMLFALPLRFIPVDNPTLLLAIPFAIAFKGMLLIMLISSSAIELAEAFKLIEVFKFPLVPTTEDKDEFKGINVLR